jgi:flagellar biosynthesis/type III secretory pathway protein FliH
MGETCGQTKISAKTMGSRDQIAYAGESTRPRLVDLDRRRLSGGTQLGVTNKSSYFRGSIIYYKVDEQQWLKERFEKMKDILEGSWAYQEMFREAKTKGLKQGLEQGLEQGLKQGLDQGKKEIERLVVHFVETHFPDLVPLAKQQVAHATTSQQLQKVLEKLFVARTSNEAEAVLLGK